MATGIIDTHQLDPEEKARLYSGHDSEALVAVARLLLEPGPSPVLLLAGPPGCGRTGLLEAAALSAGGAGGEAGPISVLPLDLDGYEEGTDLSRFAEIQIARRWELDEATRDRKSTRLNSSHSQISYAVFCLKKKKKKHQHIPTPRPHQFSRISCHAHFTKDQRCYS